MRVIDAINKINKEEKFRFRLLCDGDIYKYIGGSLYNETVGERAEWIIDNKWLNEEIEIIEEPQEHKIPKKIEICYSPDIEEEIFYEKGNKPNHYVLGDAGNKLIIGKINEILDYLEVNND